MIMNLAIQVTNFRDYAISHKAGGTTHCTIKIMRRHIEVNPSLLCYNKISSRF